jgi:hypothetical protein
MVQRSATTVISWRGRRNSGGWIRTDDRRVRRFNKSTTGFPLLFLYSAVLFVEIE